VLGIKFTSNEQMNETFSTEPILENFIFTKSFLNYMPLYEKKLWKKIFGKKDKASKIEPLKDIESIKEFLSEISSDVKVIQKDLKKLEELEKEYKIAKSGIIQINLETQAGVIEELMERYQFLQNDIDINGLRVKMIAEEFLKRAQKAGMKDLAAEKQKSDKWKLLW